MTIVSFVAACGPSVKPGSVPDQPSPVGTGAPKLKVSPEGRRVMVGEMCPQGAGGRPAVTPLMMRGAAWTDATAELTAVVERGTVPRFAVFGVDGKQAGAFETLGLVDVAPGQSVASGAYVGASPCTYAVTAKPTPGQLDTRGEDPKCGPVTKGCGIAIGEIARPDEVADNVSYVTGGACMSGTDLTVDIDGDGTPEAFPIANVLDGIRAPAAEWLAVEARSAAAASAAPTPPATATAGAPATPAPAGPCKPVFQVYDLRLAPPPRAPAKPVKGVGVASGGDGIVTVDVLGVIDLDADGRRELILAMRFPTVRSIVVYTATSNPQRLELAGEGQSFAR
jgi:hypothetical protein